MKFAVNWFHNVNLALYSNRIMPDRCLVHGCSSISDMNAGISAHFIPTIKRERDTWLRFVHTHRANLNPSGIKFVAGVFSPFRRGMFFRAFHMEGCRRRLIPGSIPTIRKIEPGKQSSKRQHRKVSLGQFYLSFSAVLCHSWSFLFRRRILYVYSQTSLRIVNIFSSNSLSLVLFISPRCCILVVYPFCLFQSCGALGRCWFTDEPFNGFQSF